jgi:hypothetical protein
MSHHWVCQVCHLPLDGEGFIHVFNLNPALGAVGDYPRERSPDFDPVEVQDSYIAGREVATMREEQEMQVKEALRFLNRPVNIGFGAYHPRCDPYAGRGNYTFPAYDRMESLVGWVLHLQEKTWFGQGDTERLLGFWWTHKGEEVPPPG